MKEKVVTIILYCACLASFLWLSRALFLGNYPDFTTQYFATISLFNGGNPYEIAVDLFTPQVYPPITSFFYFPFTLFPLDISQTIFSVLSLVSLIVVFMLLSKTFSLSFFSKTNICIMTLSFAAFPTKFTLGMGQINIFILLFLSASLFFYHQKKQYYSGVLVGLSLAVKLFPLLLIPFLFFKKKVLLGIVASLLGLFLASILFIPISHYIYFLFEVLPTLFSGWKVDYYNQAVSGLMGRGWGVNEFTNTMRIAISLLIVGLTYIAVFAKKQHDIVSFALRFSVLIVVSLMVNTFSWQHHFVWLVIPFYVVAIYFQKQRASKFSYLLLIASYLLVALNIPSPQEVPTIFQSHVLFGTLLLWFLHLHILRTERVR